VNALQNALNRCKNHNFNDKKEHYYDAVDARTFEEIFKTIGARINENPVRIKS